jgi:hypothetical protein
MKTDCYATPTWNELTCCSLPGGRLFCFNAGSQKTTSVATFSYSTINALNLTRSYRLLWRYSLVSVWELLATDGAAGVIPFIFPLVSLLVDRPRVLGFWKQSIICTLWICLTDWQASTAVNELVLYFRFLQANVLELRCVLEYETVWSCS